MSDLRVLIIADDPLARAGLAALLAEQLGLVVTGRAAGADDLAAAIAVYRPDIVLWDLGVNPDPSIERLASLRAEAILILTLLPDESHAGRVWAAGGRGLLRRDAEPAHLAAALAAMVEGLAVLDPTFAVALFASPAPPEPSEWRAEEPPLREELTPRELQVLRLIADGLPNKTIANRLGISEHTVKFHINAILGKLGVESRTEAVVRATRLGLILL